jgi:hypothetical protein
MHTVLAVDDKVAEAAARLTLCCVLMDATTARTTDRLGCCRDCKSRSRTAGQAQGGQSVCAGQWW